jgi:cytoskeletal protein CcmA (bactofilin family)
MGGGGLAAGRAVSGAGKVSAPGGPSSAQDTLIIDPVQMNIVNRVAEGCALEGSFEFAGGLLLQGSLRGSGRIAGRLVIWHTGQLQGRYTVLGDVYVLGHLGGVADEADAGTSLECQGTIFVASSGICTGSLHAARLRMYEGAVLQGPFKTLRHGRALPQLDPR